MCLVCLVWSKMISYKTSVAPNFFSMIINDLLRITGVLDFFRLNDRQWSLTRPRLPKNVSYSASYDRQWSFMKRRLPKNVFYLFSMIVIVPSKASCAEKWILLEHYDDKWSLAACTAPVAQYMFYLTLHRANSSFFAFFRDLSLARLFSPTNTPECLIGQISWNSRGRIFNHSILIKKVHFEIERAG